MHDEAAFACEIRSAGAARRWVRGVIEAWALPAADEVGPLLVSEVVSNAVRHANSDVRLIVDLRDDRRLVVEAWDRGPGRPVLRRPARWDESGRGLQLLDTLSTRWGWTFARGAKCVWFELATDAVGSGGGPDYQARATTG
ncbi:MAG TPA: ATP-binding protein [Acidimicrobiales bacterium]|nr:ATP-binding protein [Acidimicrobiales bacterium]